MENKKVDSMQMTLYDGKLHEVTIGKKFLLAASVQHADWKTALAHRYPALEKDTEIVVQDIWINLHGTWVQFTTKVKDGRLLTYDVRSNDLKEL